MSAPEEEGQAPKQKTRDREARLARALRENLKRRKDQARERAAAAEPYADHPEHSTSSFETLGPSALTPQDEVVRKACALILRSASESERVSKDEGTGFLRMRSNKSTQSQGPKAPKPA